MSNCCRSLHQLFNKMEIHRFPFDGASIPADGIYVLFEEREFAHDTKRIVRIGTHTGSAQLRSRLQQHFVAENKDRSIFRKNIGRALLNKSHDPFLDQWQLDLTTRDAKEKFSHLVDFNKQKEIERQVTAYIRQAFSFVAFSVSGKDKRLEFESKLISTISHCNECTASKNWLGLHSPVKKIQESGLWLVNELYKTPLNEDEFMQFQRMVAV